MLDLIIAGLLLALILASILRRGIQQFILLGLLALLGVIAIARIPGRLTTDLPGTGNQTIDDRALVVRPAFRDAALSIGASQSQWGRTQPTNGGVTGPRDEIDRAPDTDFSDSSQNAQVPESPIQPNPSSGSNPNLDDVQRAWW